MENPYYFTQGERDLLDRLSHPRIIQEYLDGLTYDFDSANGERDVRSFRRVVQEQRAICLDGALTAATALEYHGFDVTFLKFVAVSPEKGLSHLVVSYQQDNKVGTVGFSRYESWRGKPLRGSLKQLKDDYHHSAQEEDYFILHGHLVN